jgi:hypothetical protein
MESFKNHSRALKDFIRPPQALNGFLAIHCWDDLNLCKFSASYTGLKAAVHFLNQEKRLSAKVASQEGYIYKYRHLGKSLPINFKCKFEFFDRLAKKNCISFEYEHPAVNMNLKVIKVKEQPMNLVFNSTFGRNGWGVHNKVKSSLRLNKLQKCQMGFFTTLPSLSLLCKLNLLSQEGSLFMEKRFSSSLHLSQLIQYTLKSESLNLQMGFVKTNPIQTWSLKLNSKGEVFLSLIQNFSETFKLEAASKLDLSKSTSKSLSGGVGLKLIFNFNLAKEQ